VAEPTHFGLLVMGFIVILACFLWGVLGVLEAMEFKGGLISN
jgi:hypothetical protein